VSSPFLVGLNPYGLTYTLGLQGLGTPRANPDPGGLEAFLRIADEIGARTLELDLRWLTDLDEDALGRLALDATTADMTIICSTWLQHEPGETLASARRIAAHLGGALIRMHLTPVLEGGRAAQGDRWPRLVDHARKVLTAEAAIARDEGLRIGIEDHQDFGSEELLAFADEAGDNVGIVFDTGNPFAVGEDPVAFIRRVAHRLVHVHLKDYRAQFTSEGYKLVRCAIGDGCVPFDEIADVITSQASPLPLTASLEPAALEARHIRLFTRNWWHGYGPRDASEFGEALGRLRHRCLESTEDSRTPWERDAPSAELIAYERNHLNRSVHYARQLGWLPTPPSSEE
jgi:sugar phosphate isomerase/epimerase